MFQEKPHGRKYVIAVPFRTDYYSNYARILERAGMLRKALLWTRYGFADVDDARQDLLPILG